MSDPLHPLARPPLGTAHIKSLLRERNQQPERMAEIDQSIRETFQQRGAVLVLDMCGFSRLTAKYGIIFYMAMIVQMEEAATPAVRNNGGLVFKQDADNLFCLFPSARSALEGARDIFLAFESVNSVLPEERDIRGSIGIGYGELLVLRDPATGEVEDVFGEEMNSASRLGEDLACGSEILLTPAAHAALPAGRYVTEPAVYRHQDSDVPCHRYLDRRA